jgi:hypothetical protein
MMQGASLFGALTAKAALLADLKALREAIAAGSLDNAAATRVEEAVRRLPQYGVDWSSAILMESTAGAMALNQFATSRDPRKLYEEAFGEPMPARTKAPSASEIAQFQTLMTEVAKAFQRDDPAPPELATLESKIRSLNPIVDRATPNLARVVGYRRETALARQQVLDALGNRRR